MDCDWGTQKGQVSLYIFLLWETRWLSDGNWSDYVSTQAYTLLTAPLKTSTSPRGALQMSINQSNTGNWGTNNCSCFHHIICLYLHGWAALQGISGFGPAYPANPAMPPCSLGIFALELAWGSAMPWITFLLKARGDGEMEDTGGFGPEQQGNDKELGWIRDEGGNTNNKKQR